MSVVRQYGEGTLLVKTKVKYLRRTGESRSWDVSNFYVKKVKHLRQFFGKCCVELVVSSREDGRELCGWHVGL